MKNGKFVIIVLALVIVLTGAYFAYEYLRDRYSPSSESINEPEVSDTDTAADFSVMDMSGNTVKLSDYFGKPIVINFWATWCGPCNSELPAFDEMYRKYGDDIIFMMVDLTDGVRDTVDNVESFIAEKGYSFPVFFDIEFSAVNAYSIRSIPLSVFIDQNGKLVQQHIGAMSSSVLQECIEMLQK